MHAVLWVEQCWNTHPWKLDREICPSAKTSKISSKDFKWSQARNGSHTYRTSHVTRHTHYAFIVSFSTDQFSDNTMLKSRCLNVHVCVCTLHTGVWGSWSKRTSKRHLREGGGLPHAFTHSRMSAEIKATVLLTSLHFKRPWMCACERTASICV